MPKKPIVESTITREMHLARTNILKRYLTKAQGNVKEAARALGITTSSLFLHIKNHNLHRFIETLREVRRAGEKSQHGKPTRVDNSVEEVEVDEAEDEGETEVEEVSSTKTEFVPAGLFIVRR